MPDTFSIYFPFASLWDRRTFDGVCYRRPLANAGLLEHVLDETVAWHTIHAPQVEAVMRHIENYLVRPGTLCEVYAEHMESPCVCNVQLLCAVRC